MELAHKIFPYFQWPESFRKERFIISPLRDLIFLLGTPVMGLLLALFLFSKPVSEAITGQFADLEKGFVMAAFGNILIQAHIILVLVRSHLNPGIRALHPIKFQVVPLVLLCTILLSDGALLAVSFVSFFWDIYHSGMQTFGLARIYDRRAGNDPNRGRGLDIYFSHFIYAGAIVGGINFIPTVVSSFEVSSMRANLDLFAEWAKRDALILQRLYFFSFAAFLLFYFRQIQKYRSEGLRISWQKVALLTVTGSISTYGWLFLDYGAALFLANFYHAVQYFAIVWATEKATLIKTSAKWIPGPRVLLGLFLILPFGYGALIAFHEKIFAHFIDMKRAVLCLSITCSVLHFWYDGFIWSVRRNQV